MYGRPYVLFALFLRVTFACDFPNGTETAINWWDCGDGTFKVYTATPLDMDMNYVYPIRLVDKMIVSLDLDNQAGFLPGPDLTLDFTLAQYGGWGGCKWTDVPTFGLLSNLPACELGVPCPIDPGRQTLNVIFDFTRFKAIINLLKNDAPYQTQVKLTDKVSGHYLCMMVQTRAFTV